MVSSAQQSVEAAQCEDIDWSTKRKVNVKYYKNAMRHTA